MSSVAWDASAEDFGQKVDLTVREEMLVPRCSLLFDYAWLLHDSSSESSITYYSSLYL
jgi:hypothetical protein